LLGFLLRLDRDQEAVARCALKAKGATLLKGGPGTGKSTAALYRVREILAGLRKAKLASPKVLFTTYAHALTRVSEQLLTSLVGKEGMEAIDVKTADSILRQIALDGGAPATLVKDPRQALGRALEEANFQGSNLKVASQKAAVGKMSRHFLLDEILRVIEDRGLSTLEEYLKAARPARRSALTKVQREAVWRVRDAFLAELAEEGATTTEGWRRRAAERIRSGEVPARYDAVVIDEPQNGSPTAIAALVGLCKTAQGVFLTADANQSIYTSADASPHITPKISVKT
jgi:superfamily I DNA/RNA helicase